MNKKRAFTLAELMIVMLVITLIFAAFAPMITKRRIVADRNNKVVWNWFNSSKGMDAYYIPAAPNNSGTAFFGVEPTSKEYVFSQYAPNARIVVNAQTNNPQFRFYYSPKIYDTDSNYGFLGKWQMTRKNNLVLGGGRDQLFEEEAEDNVVFGYDAGKNITNARRQTLVGYKAGESITDGYLYDKGAVYVGAYAGKSAKYSGSESNIGSTFIGASAGELVNRVEGGSVHIGYAAGAWAKDSWNDVYIGALAGPNHSYNEAREGSNVAIGYRSLSNLKNGSVNNAIGAGALYSLKEGHNNTAIGYLACDQLVKSSYKTCIGAYSGPTKESSAYKSGGINAINEPDTDYHIHESERTYIGAQPKNFGGDAVLEIHNVDYDPEDSNDTENRLLANSPNVHSNATTVINGNLIVKGNSFLTFGNKLRMLGTEDVTLADNSNATIKNALILTDKRVLDEYEGFLHAQTSYSFYGSYYKNGPINDDPFIWVSDRRLKNISSENKDGLDKIRQLKVFNYTFKADKDKKPQVGVIAQDLQKVFPNSVSKNSKGFLQIRWDEMLYAVVNSIKELSKQVTAYVKDVVTLENKITKLEKENLKLQNKVNSLNTRLSKLKN